MPSQPAAVVEVAQAVVVDTVAVWRLRRRCTEQSQELPHLHQQNRARPPSPTAPGMVALLSTILLTNRACCTHVAQGAVRGSPPVAYDASSDW